jgi:hypothetical protein
MLMRFHSPDAASPFRHGGLNAYVYCIGDPVNHSDPSGEGLWDWIMVGIGIVASGIAAAMSGGTLLPALGAVITLSADVAQTTAVALLALDVTSIGLGIGSAKAMDDGNDALASKLGLGSMVLGLAGLTATGAFKLGSRAGKAALPGARRVNLAPVESPVALKAPPDGPATIERLRGGHDPGNVGRVSKRFPTTREMRLMDGFDRVNAAAASPLTRRMLISGGMASAPLLDQFPHGIDLTHRGAVIHARHIFSSAILGLDGLNEEMLSRTGFGRNAFESLNPSLVPGGADVLEAEETLLANLAIERRIPATGELLYRRFLDTRLLVSYGEYAMALCDARRLNQWMHWNR